MTRERLGWTLQIRERREPRWSFVSKGRGALLGALPEPRAGLGSLQTPRHSPGTATQPSSIGQGTEYHQAQLPHGLSLRFSPSCCSSRLALILSGRLAGLELLLDLGAHVLLPGERHGVGTGCAQGSLSPSCPFPVPSLGSYRLAQPPQRWDEPQQLLILRVPRPRWHLDPVVSLGRDRENILDPSRCSQAPGHTNPP